MNESELLVTGATILAFVVAGSTVILWFLPTPEKAKEIFVLSAVPLWYLRFYNLVRWMSGNRAWKDTRNGSPAP